MVPGAEWAKDVSSTRITCAFGPESPLKESRVSQYCLHNSENITTVPLKFYNVLTVDTTPWPTPEIIGAAPQPRPLIQPRCKANTDIGDIIKLR
jgi:hypothetical protein